MYRAVSLSWGVSQYWILLVWLHSQDDCQPAIVHEVAVSASGVAVCVGAHWVIIYMTWVVMTWMAVVIMHTPNHSWLTYIHTLNSIGMYVRQNGTWEQRPFHAPFSTHAYQINVRTVYELSLSAALINKAKWISLLPCSMYYAPHTYVRHSSIIYSCLLPCQDGSTFGFTCNQLMWLYIRIIICSCNHRITVNQEFVDDIVSI